MRREVPGYPGIYVFNASGDPAREPDGAKPDYFPITYCEPSDDGILGLDLNDDVEARARGRARCARRIAAHAMLTAAAAAAATAAAAAASGGGGGDEGGGGFRSCAGSVNVPATRQGPSIRQAAATGMTATAEPFFLRGSAARTPPPPFRPAGVGWTICASAGARRARAHPAPPPPLPRAREGRA